MKTILFICLLIPSFVFSQHIPTNSKILNITYDKPKGTKIEKEKKRKKRRYRNYNTLGLGLGVATFLNQKNKIGYIPSNISMAWQKRWSTHIYSSLGFNSSYINVENQQEDKMTTLYSHSLEALAYYYLFPATYHWFTDTSPYILTGLNLTYVPKLTAQPILGINFGLGYYINVSPKIDFYIEQKVNYFTINQEEFFLGSFQLGVSYTILHRKKYQGGLPCCPGL